MANNVFTRRHLRDPLSHVATAVCLAALAACDPGASNLLVSAPGPPAVDTSSVTGKDGRTLGISISDRSDGDFNRAYDQAVDAGMEATGLSLAWDDLEVSPGVYDPEIDFLQIANDFYGPRGTAVTLGLNPIDTNNRRVPAHLDGLAWDDPSMINAFTALLDWALPKVDGLNLYALSIGNEIDATLSSPDEWQQYTNFLAAVISHARTLRGGVSMGAKITAAGLTEGWAVESAALNEVTDVVLTTYYPLGDGFVIEPPGTVADVFDDVTSRFPTHTIAFAEIGAPSTTQCGSSEELQAEFIAEAFRAWDRHASQVDMLEFVWMHDISSEQVAVFENYYGVSDPCFLEYLATLGMKTASGLNKRGWEQLEAEAAARGW